MNRENKKRMSWFQRKYEKTTWLYIDFSISFFEELSGCSMKASIYHENVHHFPYYASRLYFMEVFE